MGSILDRYPVRYRLRWKRLDIRIRTHAIDLYWRSRWRLTVSLGVLLWRRDRHVHSVIASGWRVRYSRDELFPS